MTNNIVFGLIIAFIYLVIKFLDMRYIKKEIKPLKDIILDSLLVFISTLISFFILNQFNFDELISDKPKITDAFTGNPEF